MIHRGGAALALAATLVTANASAAQAGWQEEAKSSARGSVVRLSAFRGELDLRAYAKADVPPAIQLFQLRRAALCNVTSGILEGDMGGACAPPDGSVVPNCDGDEPVQPLWRRDRAAPDSPWEPWRLIVGWACPDDLLPTMTAADFRQLPITPQVVHMQPDRGWVLVNKETIVLTDEVEQAFRTDLFGYGVEVVATPTRWSWDFGDDSRDLSTDSPGRPYPDFDVFHVYTEPDSATAITLTTTWSGRYRVDGDDAWREVTGTAETTSTSAAFEVVERRSHLVSKDCNEDPDQPGCG